MLYALVQRTAKSKGVSGVSRDKHIEWMVNAVGEMYENTGFDMSYEFIMNTARKLLMESTKSAAAKKKIAAELD
jgi:hypothetical protein